MNTFLIVRLGSLGDIIHAVPAAAALRKSFPQASIDWLVDQRHRDLLELVPVVDRRIVVNTGSAGSLSSVLRRAAARPLRCGAGSAGAAEVSGPCAVVRRCARHRISTGSPARAGRPLFLHGNRRRRRASCHRQVSVDVEGRWRADAGSEFPLDDRSPHLAAEARSRLGIADGKRFALINPGAAWPNKRWPPVYLAEVSRELAKRHDLRSLVLWGPGEEHIAQAVVTASDNTAAMSPPTSIRPISLIKAAALIISGDTGPMHIAGASGTPLVGIFGPTDPQRNGPWGEDDLVVSRSRSCACHYQRERRLSGWCLLDISPREVMELVDRRLAGV